MFEGTKDTRAVGYVRVSTEEQAREGYSLDAQEARIRAYCAAKGWSLVRVYRDQGKSAYRTMKRPEYDALMAARDSWDVLVVWKLNRLHRRLPNLLKDVGTIDEAKKGFVSIDESFDTTTAMGTFVMQLLGALAQLESGQTAERVVFALDQKFKSGKPENFGRPAFGYSIPHPKETGGDGLLVVVPSEAEIVRRIFAAIIAGRTTREIVRDLKASGFRGKLGGQASEVEVVQIAHGPVYAGYVHRGGILRRNGHEAIVSDETFNRAQIALYRRTSRHHRVPLIVGADEIVVTRTTPKGKSLTAFIPAVRPPGLDAMVAAEALRSPVRRHRKPRAE